MIFLLERDVSTYNFAHRKLPTTKQRDFVIAHFYAIYQLSDICKEYVRLSDAFVDLLMVIHEQGVVRGKIVSSSRHLSCCQVNEGRVKFFKGYCRVTGVYSFKKVNV